MRILPVAALVAAGFAMAAWAGTEATCGHPTSGSRENRVALRLCDEEACFARVEFTNGREVGCRLTWEAALDHEGFVVLVRVEVGDGDAPDRIVVVPPPGFLAEPPELDVEENTSTTIAIVPVPLS